MASCNAPFLDDLQPPCGAGKRDRRLTNSPRLPARERKEEKKSTNQRLFILAKCMPGCLALFISSTCYAVKIERKKLDTRAVTSPALKKSIQLLSQRTNAASLLLSHFGFVEHGGGRRLLLSVMATRARAVLVNQLFWKDSLGPAFPYKATKIGFRHFSFSFSLSFFFSFIEFRKSCCPTNLQALPQ